MAFEHDPSEAQVQEPPFFEPPKLLEEESGKATFFEVEVRKDSDAAEEQEETVQSYPASLNHLLIKWNRRSKKRSMTNISSGDYMNGKHLKYMSQLKKKRSLKKT